MVIKLFEHDRYILLFACIAILISIFIILYGASLLITDVKSNPKITTQFNFPRYYNTAELEGPPPIKGKVRTFLYTSGQSKRGNDVNYTDILKKGPYDVVIISDSFIGGSPAGQYMCRKISAENNVSVLIFFANWFDYSGGSAFNLLTLLTNNGFLKKSGAKYVIFGAAERGLPGLVTESWDLNTTKPLPKFQNTINKPKVSDDSFNIPTPVTDIEAGIKGINTTLTNIDNYFDKSGQNIIVLKTWTINDIYSIIGQTTNDGTLYFLPMNESRFTNPLYASRLIFIKGDIESWHRGYCPDEFIKVNNRLNMMSERLQDQNITLIFIPGVSAYNTYYPYIVNPPTVRDPFFEVMRTLNKSYVFVDTKAIVDELQSNGIKDLSGTGDPAHWTWKTTYMIPQTLNLNSIPLDTQRPVFQDPHAEYERAVLAFRSVIYERGTNNDPWAYNNDGRIYELFGDTTNATRCYKRSLELDPDQPDIMLRLQNLQHDP